MLQRFSLSWDHHNQNICNGLSTLQQNGELVDMTLAADGHMVKVHQIVMSLISPYIKELILSANCPHPVIFLNKISYNTLCLILEFIYRGEVLVEKETLPDLVQAGKELHIKGLQDLLQKSRPESEDHTTHRVISESHEDGKDEVSEDHTTHRVISESHDDGNDEVNDTGNTSNVYESSDMVEEHLSEGSDQCEMEQYEELESDYENDDTYTMTDITETNDNSKQGIVKKLTSKSNSKTKILPKAVLSANIKVAGTDIDYSIDPSMLQYTVSCQGSLQVVLNKFIYYLRYTSKSESKHIVWRCVEYIKHRCPAYIVSRGSNVLRRVAMHTHPNHERRIRKKMIAGEIFDRVNRAEEYGAAKKQQPKSMK